MQLKQVDIFYNDNNPELFRQLLLPLQQELSKEFYSDWCISREWINGPHYRLLLNVDDFFYSAEAFERSVRQIEEFLCRQPSPDVDNQAYAEKQKKLMKVEKVEIDPELVYANNSVRVRDLDSLELSAKYESESQWLSVFRANCKIRPFLLDINANRNECEQQQLFDIMMLLAVIYQPKVNAEADFGEYNGFLSYFSNYTFWHHSLATGAAEQIKQKFEQDYTQDQTKYSQWLSSLNQRLATGDNQLKSYADWLKNQYRNFTQMACDEVIHHRSPYPKEMLAEITKVSSFHQKHFYTDKGEGSAFPTDFSSYRWLLNIVYRFFPLLNFTPLNRQYFNYSLSRFELENRSQVYALREAFYLSH